MIRTISEELPGLTPEEGANDAHADESLEIGSPQRPDAVAYLADMILELKQMADTMQLGMLSRILDLAHSEAEAQFAKRCP